MRGLRTLLAATLLATLPCKFLFAELVHVRDYHSHEPRDRKVRFALAVTPEQDVLSFVAKANGIWRLTRIRGWLENTPTEQTIDVPGWPAKKMSKSDSEFLTFLHASLVITPDGQYAVATATGEWTRNGEKGQRIDNNISLIDLRTFRTTNTTHTSSLTKPSEHFGLAKAIPASEVADVTAIPGKAHCVATGITHDGHFKKESCETYHLGAWNRNHITDKLVEKVLSVETGKLVGIVEETTHDSVHSQFAEQNGNPYLVVVEGGFRLKVYQIIR